MLQQQQQQQVQNQGQMMAGAGGMRPQAAGGVAPPISTMPKQALQQLLLTLKSPNSPDQQQQILQVSPAISNVRRLLYFCKSVP